MLGTWARSNGLAAEHKSARRVSGTRAEEVTKGRHWGWCGGGGVVKVVILVGVGGGSVGVGRCLGVGCWLSSRGQ